MDQPLVTAELAFRLLHAEADCCLAKLRAMQDPDHNARGVEIARLGGALLLTIQSQRDNPYYNRVLDFGPDDVERLDEVVAWMHARGVRYWFDLLPALVHGPGSPLLRRLAELELHPTFFLNVLWARPEGHAQPLPEEITIDEIDLDRPEIDFAFVLSEGMGIPEEMVESTRRAAQIEHAAFGWQTYLASVEGHPAAIATMYVHEGMASIDAMATRPCYRRRGCQAALLGRCLDDAARAGCEYVVSQTVPSSTSEKNFLRGRFHIAYTKTLYSEL